MLLEQKMSKSELFLKDRVTPKTGIMVKINQLCVTKINYILNCIELFYKMQYFLIKLLDCWVLVSLEKHRPASRMQN